MASAILLGMLICTVTVIGSKQKPIAPRLTVSAISATGGIVLGEKCSGYDISVILGVEWLLDGFHWRWPVGWQVGKQKEDHSNIALPGPPMGQMRNK